MKGIRQTLNRLLKKKNRITYEADILEPSDSNIPYVKRVETTTLERKRIKSKRHGSNNIERSVL